jgi:DNA repair exonuclease SbcCD ATPase subunit
MQLQLLESVRQIADKDLTQQNLQLYSALKNSTKEIETLAKYLANCNDYLANVRVLNEKLDLQESRTRTIEEVGKFFRDLEADSLKVVGKIDATLQEALEKLKEHTVSSLQELQKSSVKQQDILRQKTEEINSIVDELKNLSAIKESIAKFEKAMSAQNNKLDTLANAIQTLAKARVEGTSIPQKPIWEKALVIALSMTGGLLLALLIWNGILFFWNDIFKI